MENNKEQNNTLINYWNKVILDAIKRELINILSKTAYKDFDLNDKSRIRKNIEIRQTIYWYLRHDLNLTLNEIGYIFNKYHAAIINGLKQADININFYANKSMIELLIYLRANTISYLTNLY